MDKEFYKMKGKHVKGRGACVVWEEDDEISFSSSNYRSDDEYTNLYLMAHKKSEDSEVYNFDPEVKPSYKQLSKAFSEMHVDALSISRLDQDWNTKQERKDSASSPGEPLAILRRHLAQRANSEAQA
ncbi:hypothetical protein KIW84_030847 [Lathyrus oleraceus]|uniref:Uncharacterized protein n=1 Tax=Pisum sativum TaxID=3888 RepID=A0A9D4XTT5_PEA|nr:hypothetical protein KIW84_030847 [Pisum sativum]